MSKYNENISYLIKMIYRNNPGEVKLKIDGTKKTFSLDYYISEKIAKELRNNYYFGTEIRTDSFSEYLNTFKELLQIKRALKKIS